MRQFPVATRLLACAAVLLFGASKQSVAADTDVSVSTNAGFSPYFLQAELEPRATDRLFGIATSISGQHAAVMIQQDFGAVYGSLALFDEAADGSTWLAADRAPSNNGRVITEGPSDFQSCFSVASDGGNVILGEPTMTLIESQYEQGGASLFRHSTSHWSLSGLLSDPMEDDGQFFGCSVAISGSTAVIGAPLTSGGAIFIANLNGEGWSIVQKIEPPSDSPNYFGSAVAISGNRIVVGAPGEGYEVGVDNRAVVYVLDQQDGSWKVSAAITAQDMSPGDDFAHAVAVDHDTVAVGARAKNWNAGAVYIYRKVSDSWLLAREFQESTAPGRKSFFGFSVSMQNGRLLVGEPGLARAHLFQQEGTDWAPRATFATESADSQFGFTVATSEKKIIVGAYSVANGRAYIFRDDELFGSGFER